jgi:hypothetical protein
MNYRKIYNQIVDAGYYDAPTDSKLHRVGLKVLKRKDRQSFNRRITLDQWIHLQLQEPDILLRSLN